MLETSEERVRLLKAGLTDKAIEQLYIVHNNIKIIDKPLLFNLVSADAEENGSSPPDRGIPAEYF